MKNLKLSLNIQVLKSKLHNITYRKIPLIRPGRIYGQRTNGRKNTSTCNLETFFLSFFQYKVRILAFFTSCNIWNMFKANNKDTRIHKANNKVKNKESNDFVLACLLLT